MKPCSSWLYARKQVYRLKLPFHPPWLNYENFYKDFGAKPTGTVFKLFDQSLGYIPGNCGWVVPNKDRIGKPIAHRNKTKHPSYRKWHGLRQMVKAGSKDSPYYADKGIGVCARWVNSFEAFVEDMGAAPENSILLREDKGKGFEPGNCYWAVVKSRPKGHPLAHTWRAMLSRCHNPDNLQYDNYGGRGIQVCAEWREDFWKFVEDMGGKPKGYMLDRIDNSKGYCKSNCRWVNPQRSSWNRRVTVWVSYQGRAMPMSVAAKLAGVHWRKWREWAQDKLCCNPDENTNPWPHPPPSLTLPPF